MYEGLGGICGTKDGHVVDETGFLAEVVEQLTVERVYVDCAVVFGVKYYWVKRAAAELGQTDAHTGRMSDRPHNFT